MSEFLVIDSDFYNVMIQRGHRNLVSLSRVKNLKS